MKTRLILLLTLLSFGVYGQKVVDTAQIVVPGKSNSPATLEKPYVILISADGFRYDYMEKYNAVNLKKLAESGSHAKKGMYPSFPSATFPNHYTIATGMYPANHGLVNNRFYDPNRDEFYSIGSESIKDGSWYGGVPLWTLAESQGMKAASLFWVGSESDAGGIRPGYYYPYHEEFSSDEKVRIIKNWLTLPEEQRPHFITLYFPEVDHMGHRHGPDAKETEEAVLFVDETIKKLTEALEPLNLPINYIFLSDHGMIAVEEADYIPMPEVDSDKFVTVNSNTFAMITAKNKADILPLYKELKKNRTKDYKVYLAENTPKRLKFSTRETDSRRIGDIILIPKGSKILMSPGRKTSYGKHGFSACKVSEMKSVFFAWGPAFKSDKTMCKFQNVDVYPLVAEILDLKIDHKIDGDLRKLKRVLKK